MADAGRDESSNDRGLHRQQRRRGRAPVAEGTGGTKDHRKDVGRLGLSDGEGASAVWLERR
jgi:hypothetical protein